MSPIQVQSYAQQPPRGLLDLLKTHLPYSLVLVNRLEATLHGPPSPNSFIILAAEEQILQYIASDSDIQPQDNGLTVAYVEFSSGPDTQMWLYSTLEDGKAGEAEAEAEEEAQLGLVVGELSKLARGRTLYYAGNVLLGTLHSRTRELLEGMGGRVKGRATGVYDKFVFREEDIPAEGSLPAGMGFERARRADCELVVSRTDIPRRAEMLETLPNCMVKLDDGTPVAWAFLGHDGSLMSLHTEEGYRGQGLAKALTIRLFRDNLPPQGPERSFAADVSPGNAVSRRLCEGLGGRPLWQVSW